MEIPNYDLRYYSEFLKFRNNPKNKEKSEVDFLKQEISKFEDRIKEANLSEEEITSRILEKDPGVADDQKYLQFLIDDQKRIFEDIVSKTQFLKNDYEVRLNRVSPTPPVKNKPLRIRGKVLNMSERFTIANRSVNLWTTIDALNISTSKKYELLGMILGINTDNAKKLVLGNYDSKDRSEVVEEYLQTLFE